MRIQKLVGAMALLFCSLGQSGAFAQQEFFQGKTVTIIAGSAVGGGIDVYARLIGRHLSKHVPGKPSVIVQNMPGAGSLTSVLYLDSTAPKDGSVITTFNPGIIMDSITDPSRAKKKFNDLGWVGSATDSFRMCYFWHKSRRSRC
jgi:tripartite-type tricarboxylate transporter receptor subunit TctC